MNTEILSCEKALKRTKGKNAENVLQTSRTFTKKSVHKRMHTSTYQTHQNYLLGGGAATVELLEDGRAALPPVSLRAAVDDGRHWGEVLADGV